MLNHCHLTSFCEFFSNSFFLFVQNETKYKPFKNNLNKVLKKAEKQHFSDILASCKSNIKRTWQILKEIVNKRKVKKVYSSFKLNDSTTTENKNVISNKFNEFFTKSGPNL